MSDRHRWGIAATGRIAGIFARDLALLDTADLVAVGSRSSQRAEEFGSRFNVPHRHGSYDALADDPDVEIVFVASPVTSHHTDVLRFLRAGKHVLTGKPLAVNATQSRDMVTAAAERRLFLMEGMWNRFLPSYVALREILAAGRIGTPLFVDADFGAALPFDPTHRLFDPAVGGGALRNMAIYPLQLAQMVLGPVSMSVATGVIGASGVDETITAAVEHRGGGRSVSKASLSIDFACEARITGTAGHIDLPKYMHKPKYFDVTNSDGTVRVDAPFDGVGLHFQAAEVQACIAADETQSKVMPWDETIRLAELMDDCRDQIGSRQSRATKAIP
jgi:predicted dehydrogenase